MLKIDYKELLDKLETLFPNAGCELIYHNIYELTVAVMISAQTTDKKVNTVTPKLFCKYPDVYSLSKANVIEVEQIIKSIGLAKTKASNMINFANIVVNEFNGRIPSSLEELICSLVKLLKTLLQRLSGLVPTGTKSTPSAPSSFISFKIRFFIYTPLLMRAVRIALLSLLFGICSRVASSALSSCR